LNLGDPFQRSDNLTGASSCARDHLDANATGFKEFSSSKEWFERLQAKPFLFCGIWEQLQVAVVPLQADKSKPLLLLHQPGQAQCWLTGRDPAAAHAHVHLDEHFKDNSKFAGCLSHLHNVISVIDADPQLCSPSQLTQSAQLDRADDLVGDEYIPDPGIDKHLGLVELRAEKFADTPLGKVKSQSATLERLEVDAKIEPTASEQVAHPL
jgi:hypothetical protein